MLSSVDVVIFNLKFKLHLFIQLELQCYFIYVEFSSL